MSTRLNEFKKKLTSRKFWLGAVILAGLFLVFEVTSIVFLAVGKLTGKEWVEFSKANAGEIVKLALGYYGANLIIGWAKEKFNNKK